MMRIGERLFSLRQKSGQSLQQLADAIGASKAHLWELEKGRAANPSYELVRKLAAHFNVTIEVLTGEAAEPSRKSVEIDRIHRGLAALSDRDRDIIQQMIETMARSSEPDR